MAVHNHHRSEVPDSGPDVRAMHTVPLTRVVCAGVAEQLKMILLAEDVRAAVINGDPIRIGAAICRVIVLASDHARAAAIIEQHAADAAVGDEEWFCPTCGEAVPSNFNVCWNCCELRGVPEVRLQTIAEA